MTKIHIRRPAYLVRDMMDPSTEMLFEYIIDIMYVHQEQRQYTIRHVISDVIGDAAP